MALTRVYGRVVYPHGSDTPTPVTGDGVIEYVHATPGIIDGAVHGPDRKRIGYVAGVAEDAWLKPGMWRAYVYPDEGRSYTLHLGVPENGETTIADAVGEIVPEGIITRGEQGDPGASAYEIAVAEGFNGTEQEWLDSLKVITRSPIAATHDGDGQWAFTDDNGPVPVTDLGDGTWQIGA